MSSTPALEPWNTSLGLGGVRFPGLHRGGDLVRQAFFTGDFPRNDLARCLGLSERSILNINGETALGNIAQITLTRHQR